MPTRFHMHMRDLPIQLTINTLLVSLLTLAMRVHAAELSSVDTSIEQGQLRTTVTINENAKYRLYRLTNPHRLVLYLSDTTSKSIPTGNLALPPPLKKIRHGIHDNKNLQLIFDLEEPLTYEAGSFYDAEKNRLKLTVILKSPDFHAPSESAVNNPINTSIPPHVFASHNTVEKEPIQFDDSQSGIIKPIPLPALSSDTQTKQQTNDLTKPAKKEKKFAKLINKLKKYSRIDLHDYGTLGIQSFPKHATKESSRVDIGYKSNIGPVGFGVGLAKPLFFVSTKVSDADIKLLIEDEAGSSKPSAKLGVALDW